VTCRCFVCNNTYSAKKMSNEEVLDSFFVAGTFCLVTCVAVFGKVPIGGGGCAQGCHADQFWRWNNECYKFAQVNACSNAWAVSVGGTLNPLEGTIAYEVYDQYSCSAICSGVSDSVALPFASTDEPVRTGVFPHGVCLP
jgi:hypothetical protein